MQSLKIMQKLLMISILSMSPCFLSAITTITVNSTADTDGTSPYTTPATFVGSGIVTLRSAVRFSQGASGDPVMNIIQFDIPISDPGFQATTDSWLIQPTAVMGSTAAYLINAKPITVNAYALNSTASQPSPNTNAFPAGSNAVLRIEIQGPGVGDGVTLPARGFRILAAANTNGCVFSGLCINNFLGYPITATTGAAIRSNANNTVVSGCFIGTDILGTTSVDNYTGVFLAAGTGNVIGGNTPAASNVFACSNEIFACVTLNGGSATVQRNYIGTDKTGQIAFSRTTGGIFYISANNIITNNLISGCSGYAIQSQGGSSTTISNNLVGTDATGTRILGNGGVGILVMAFTTPANNNIVQNNIVAGCGTVGIQVCPFVYKPFSLDSNILIGNKVGLDISGTKSV